MIYLFWISLFFILYSYLGYLLLLWVLNHIRGGKENNHLDEGDIFQPRVTLIISAYNEEEVIEDKILNSMALLYPKELLEIVVVSDASQDNTEQIAKLYSGQGIVLRRFEGRIGKTGCLNKAVPLAKGDIIIFSDANSLYDRQAVQELVKHFRDPQIGFVTGCTMYVSPMRRDGIVQPIGMYSRLEMLTKDIESRIGSCVGADGAIFAVRKGLYRQLRESDINDLVVPFRVIIEGFRGLFEKKAFCVEHVAGNMKGEFYRQVRITSRTIRAVVGNVALLNPFKFGFYSIELFSHKICKLCVPFFLIVCLITNLLILNEGKAYAYLLFGQVAFYILAAIRASVLPVKGLSFFLSIPKTFAVANCAILWGWLKYLRGETYAIWRTGR